MRGTRDLLNLKAVTWDPRHGDGVLEWIGQATGATLLVGEGTLYPALHHGERQGLAESERGRSENKRTAKGDRLGAVGRRRLHAGSSPWHQFVAAAGGALRAAAPLPA
jgi:PadR family transcriptional regulator, regulatory protein PadR